MLGRVRDYAAILQRSALVRAAAAISAVAMLASCSAAPSSEFFSERDYGVKASPRYAYGGHIPKGGGHYLVGDPYRVAGRTYVPQDDPDYSAVGLASWYGRAFHGRRTANGEVYDMDDFSAAHPTLPLPSYVRVTNLANGRSMVVRVNDRGPYARGRIIDVSASVATLLDFKRKGTTKVNVQYIGPATLDGNDRKMLLASYRGPGSGGGTMIASAPASVRSPVTPVSLAAYPAPRPAAKRLPPIDFGIADPDPDGSNGDMLAPLILRTGFASSYASPNPLTPAQVAAARLAASQPADGSAASPAIIQLGSFADPDNVDRTAKLFARFGKIVTVDRLSASGTIHAVRVVLDPSVEPDTVIAAAEAAGLSGARLVNR